MNVGEGLIPGRGREQARKVLAAARAAGVSVRSVRVSAEGYVVPKEVLDEFESGNSSDVEASGAKGNRVKRKTKASKENTNA